VAVGLGNIIGAGIFVMAGAAINASGPGALVAFGLTAALAVMVGLNTAELSSKFPGTEGGVYSFAKETMGNRVGFVIGWFRLISYAVSGGAVALGFAGYLVAAGAPPSAYYVSAVVLILALTLVELRGIRLAATMEVGLVIIKVVGLGLLTAFVLTVAPFRSSDFVPLFPTGGLGVLVAANIAFFAYSGFNTIATLTPDVEDGEKVVPRAIITSIAASTVLYALVVFSLLLALNWQSYGVSSNPLALALAALNAPAFITYAIEVAALAATFAVTLSLIIAGARTTKQMGEDGLLPRALGRGSKLPGTLVSVVMIASLGLGNVQTIALVANFGVVLSYMLTGLQVVIARRRALRSSFTSPLYPYIQIGSVALSAVFLLSLGFLSLALGTVTLAGGLIIYQVRIRAGQRRGLE
jgi:basic amino acid/polyamine antiporter, APA family